MLCNTIAHVRNAQCPRATVSLPTGGVAQECQGTCLRSHSRWQGQGQDSGLLTPRPQVLFAFGGFVIAVCNLRFILGEYYHIRIKNDGESLIIAPCQASI